MGHHSKKGFMFLVRTYRRDYIFNETHFRVKCSCTVLYPQWKPADYRMIMPIGMFTVFPPITRRDNSRLLTSGPR